MTLGEAVNVYKEHESLPIIPVRLEMFLHELHDSIKPLPEGEVASR